MRAISIMKVLIVCDHKAGGRAAAEEFLRAGIDPVLECISAEAEYRVLLMQARWDLIVATHRPEPPAWIVWSTRQLAPDAPLLDATMSWLRRPERRERSMPTAFLVALMLAIGGATLWWAAR